MMRSGTHRAQRVILALSVLWFQSTAWAIFTSRIKANPISAVATVIGAPALTITALPLSTQVFSGKHFVIPVQVISNSGPLSTANLQISVVYQLFDASGNPLNGAVPEVVPVEFLQIDPSNSSRITGTAYIDRTDLNSIQFGGQLKYFFRVLQGAAGVYLGGGTAGTAAYPASAALSALLVQSGYTAAINTTFDAPISPAGSAAYAPDTFETDGLTGLLLGPGAITNAGTLEIENLDVARVPTGPGGTSPVVAYNFSLIGTSLQKSAQLVLSYPADLNGQIAGNGGNPLNLAPYWWDGASWRVLALPQIDTTLHTVTASLPPPAKGSVGKTVAAQTQSNSTQLGGAGEQFAESFALFAAGAATASSLRPTERIITPNGDGINDEAGFSGLTNGDEVHIFDVRGRRVRTLGVNDRCISLSASRCWDGRDDSGGIVASGVYIYQFTSQGDRVSGVIVVAK
jgi:hypothetical protein